MCVILFVLIGNNIGLFQNFNVARVSVVMLKSMTLNCCMAKS